MCATEDGQQNRAQRTIANNDGQSVRQAQWGSSSGKLENNLAIEFQSQQSWLGLETEKQAAGNANNNKLSAVKAEKRERGEGKQKQQQMRRLRQHSREQQM